MGGLLRHKSVATQRFTHFAHSHGMDSQLTRKQLADIERTQRDVEALKRMRGNNGIFVQFLQGIPQISFNGNAGGSGTQVIYVKITGRSGTKYSFEQYEPNSSGSPTIVTGGVTGTTSVGYLQDIAGFADSGLINLYTWAVASATIPGTWVMGPWKKYTERHVDSITSTCGTGGVVTTTLSYTDTVRYYIGG